MVCHTLSLFQVMDSVVIHGYSRSEGGPFSLAAREELTLVLGFWEPYIMFPRQ